VVNVGTTDVVVKGSGSSEDTPEHGGTRRILEAKRLRRVSKPFEVDHGIGGSNVVRSSLYKCKSSALRLKNIRCGCINWCDVAKLRKTVDVVQSDSCKQSKTQKVYCNDCCKKTTLLPRHRGSNRSHLNTWVLTLGYDSELRNKTTKTEKAKKIVCMYVPQRQSNTFGKIELEVSGNSELFEDVKQHGYLQDAMRWDCSKIVQRTKRN
jgi:hypothetical protein